MQEAFIISDMPAGYRVYVSPARVRQIYSRATRKLMGLVGPTEGSPNENMALQVPLLSCVCGKYQGWRFRGIKCDKCAEWVAKTGELITIVRKEETLQMTLS